MYIFTKKTRLFLIIITVIMIGLMAFSTLPYSKANFLENTFGIVISPLQKLSDFTLGAVDRVFSYFVNVKDLQKRNDDLKNQVEILNSDLRELSDLKTENERLRGLLELKNSNKEFNIATAQIISRSWNNWENTITLNIGEKSGIKVNDVVITQMGVVGYVYNVGTDWAKVMTLLDPSCSVSVIAPRTADDGIVQGDYNINMGQYVKMSFVDKESGISVGDTIQTSGAGGIYPSGLYIGKAIEVKSVLDGVSRQAIIETGVDFNNLSHVMVIKQGE